MFVSINRKNVNSENYSRRVDGCLAGETALVVLDTLKTLIKTVPKVDGSDTVQAATLPRVLEVLLHLLACNESVTVMEHIFATQRSIVVKVTQ